MRMSAVYWKKYTGVRSSVLYWTLPSSGCSTMCGRLMPATVWPSFGMPFSWPHTRPPPAPGRLITTICCLYFLANTSACRRAVTSDSPPGAKGTTYWIGLSGNAVALVKPKAAANKTKLRATLCRFMVSLPLNGLRIRLLRIGAIDAAKQSFEGAAAERRVAVVGVVVGQHVGASRERAVLGCRFLRQPPAVRHRDDLWMH